MATAILLQSLVPGQLFAATATSLVPGSNRQIYVYLHNTVTQANVYSDVGLTTLKTQPLITDANGAVPGYIAGEQAVDFYDVITASTLPANPLAVADVEKIANKNQPNGYAGLDSSGSLLVAQLPGAINVKSPPYSAKGDGSTDDTAAIQAAITAAAGGSLFFPHGTYVYTSLSLSSLTSTIRLVGEGPERTILAPSASASSPTITADWTALSNSLPNVRFEGLSWDLAACPTKDCLYIHNVNKLYISDCKWRQGRRQLSLGYVAASKISNTWHMNFQQAGIYVAAPNPASSGNPTGQQPNIEFDTIHGEATSTNNTIAATALIWITGFCAGLSFQNIWAIKSVASNTGTWGAGIRIEGPEAPSGAFGHFAVMNAVNTDGIDGPGLYLNNARQIQFTDSFLSTRSAANSGTDAGIHLFGTCQDIMSGGGNWISGSGVQVDVAATVNGFQSNDDTFPQTVTGGAFVVPSGPTLSNWVVGSGNRYYTAPFPDSATAGRVLLAAPSTAARATATAPRFMVSAANTQERMEYFNPPSGTSWWGDVTDSGSGWRLLDNGQRVVFALVNGGGAQVGNQTGSTNAPITIKKITAQSTAYAGNGALAGGTRDTVSVSAITNANMVTNDSVFANASIALPQGVVLKPQITGTTTITVFVENTGTASANVGACNIRTTVIQYANA